MEIKTIFSMLTNEVIPIKEDAFLDAIEDILYGCGGEETVVKLLERSFRDEDNEIRKFLSMKDTKEIDEEVVELYKELVDKRRVKLAQTIDKRLKPILSEEKEAKLREEAEKNKERYKGCVTEMIKVDEIKIPRQMKEVVPSSRKMKATLDYYKRNKEFDDIIFLDKRNYLLDGLKIYYLCKMLSITEVMVYKKKHAEVDKEI